MSEGLIVFYALIFWTIVLAVVAVGLRVKRGRPTSRDLRLEELRARYALGEMSRAEYDRRRQESETQPEKDPPTAIPS